MLLAQWIIHHRGERGDMPRIQPNHADPNFILSFPGMTRKTLSKR
jgi:hypothetical protein